MKKILMIFGIIFICLILVSSISLTILFKHGAHYDTESRSEATKIVELIGTNWDPEDIYKVSVPEMAKDEKLRENIQMISKVIKDKLGRVTAHDSLKGEANIGYYNGHKSITAKYNATIHCERDSGKIVLVLDLSGNKWLLKNFNVNSDAFFKK